MSTEENIQKILDMRQRILDPLQSDPTPQEIYEAVEALHACRGAAQAKKKAATKTIDLNALFSGDKK